jgi:hypothetical protein
VLCTIIKSIAQSCSYSFRFAHSHLASASLSFCSPAAQTDSAPPQTIKKPRLHLPRPEAGKGMYGCPRNLRLWGLKITVEVRRLEAPPFQGLDLNRSPSLRSLYTGRGSASPGLRPVACAPYLGPSKIQSRNLQPNQLKHKIYSVIPYNQLPT